MQLRIHQNKLRIFFYVIIFSAIFKPASIEHYYNLNMLFKGLKAVTILVLFFYTLFNIKNKGITLKVIKPLACLGGFWLIYIVNNCIHGTNGWSIISNAIISILLTINIYFVDMSKNKYNIISAIEIVFSIWLFIQIASLFFVNDAHIWYEPIEDGYNYFLGLDNYSSFATIPMIGILVYFDYLRYQKIRIKEKILLILLFISYIYVKSITAILALFVFIAMLMTIKYWSKIKRVVSVNKTLFLLAVLWILISVFDFQNNFATFLTSDLLEKGSYYYGITLNSRTIIWDYSIKLIQKKPIFGYGDLTNEMIQNHILYGADHCHNIFLEILLRTGVVGFVLYFYYIIYAFKLNMIRWKSKGFKILLSAMISVLLISFMDYYPTMQYLYLLYGIACFDHLPSQRIQ